MSIASKQPGETGHKPAAEPFVQEPEHRNGEPGQSLADKTLAQGKPEAREGRQEGREKTDHQHSQNRRSAAVIVHADVNPGNTDGKFAQTEPPCAGKG